MKAELIITRPATDVAVCEDWCVYFRQRDGSWLSFNSEFWSGWCDIPVGEDTKDGAIERHVLPFLRSLCDGTLSVSLDRVEPVYWDSLDELAEVPK